MSCTTNYVVKGITGHVTSSRDGRGRVGVGKDMHAFGPFWSLEMQSTFIWYYYEHTESWNVRESKQKFLSLCTGGGVRIKSPGDLHGCGEERPKKEGWSERTQRKNSTSSAERGRL